LWFSLASCGGAGEPASFAPQVERAHQAMGALQKRLIEALTGALQDGGPAEALHVCRDAAQEITREVAESEGVAVGRTSHRVRNPENAPREWARAIVAQSEGLSADAAEPHVVDLGDRIGVLRPIGTLDMCTQCHGSALDPELEAKLAELYPEDRATGFEVGDLRGWMWAEVPLSR
jgi:hypothetical protein